MESAKIKACNFNVVVQISNLPKEVDGVYVGHVNLSSKVEQAYYKGKVLDYGLRAIERDQCPELADIQEDDFIIFSDFSGIHVKTEGDFVKIIRGHDIVGITKDYTNMTIENTKPTAERILVEVLPENDIVDGVWNNVSDPRSKDVQLGRIISCGATADKYATGTIIGFDPHVGNPLVNKDGLFLKTLNSLDVEFIVEI